MSQNSVQSSKVDLEVLEAFQARQRRVGKGATSAKDWESPQCVQGSGNYRGAPPLRVDTFTEQPGNKYLTRIGFFFIFFPKKETSIFVDVSLTASIKTLTALYSLTQQYLYMSIRKEEEGRSLGFLL